LKAARAGVANGQEFYVAFSPEREDPGNQTVARRDIPKVVGGLDPRALASRLVADTQNATRGIAGPKIVHC